MIGLLCRYYTGKWISVDFRDASKMREQKGESAMLGLKCTDS